MFCQFDFLLHFLSLCNTNIYLCGIKQKYREEMTLINSQFLKVVKDEVGSKIEHKVNIFKTLNPEVSLIHLDSGDVVRPLPPCAVNALVKASKEMGNASTFKGRGPARGYSFLIDAIVKHDFRSRKIKVSADEIFINDGSKEDISGIGDILCRDNRVGVIDPVFQTYVESNVIGNRAGELSESRQWSHVIYLKSSKATGFMPEFPVVRPDVIYLCYPNDPTGCVMTKSVLKSWVDYAIKNNILLLFDATYEAFITDPEIPHSIYEIKGARRVAIEFRSFSKSAGFTGLHCGYTVIPNDIEGYSFSAESSALLNTLWLRRQTIKSYTPAYIIQCAAASLYSEEGRREIRDNVNYYMENASVLRHALTRAGFNFWGGENSPYLWVESPTGSSWDLFDRLLNTCHILSSPGERFGPCGKGFVRLSSFANQSKVILAASRISELSF